MRGMAELQAGPADPDAGGPSGGDSREIGRLLSAAHGYAVLRERARVGVVE